MAALKSPQSSSRHLSSIQDDNYVSPPVRVALLVLSIVVLVLLSRTLAGSWFPATVPDAMVFLNAVLLVVLGTLFIERHYTSPGEALANALSAGATVLLFQIAQGAKVIGWVLLAYLALVGITAIVAIMMQRRQQDPPHQGVALKLQSISYLLCSKLGRARVLFSVVFVTALIFFAKPQPLLTGLVIFWAIYLAIWALHVPQAISRSQVLSPPETKVLAYVVRVDSPHIIRASSVPGSSWLVDANKPVIVRRANGQYHWCVPLIVENQLDGVLITALVGLKAPTPIVESPLGAVTNAAEPVPPLGEILRDFTDSEAPEIVGLVREQTTTHALRVELLPAAEVVLGQVIHVMTPQGALYYQIVEGETSKEPFTSLIYGSQIATASPIGILDASGHFQKADWIPMINGPVFSHAEVHSQANSEDRFVLGSIPGTGMSLCGDFIGGLTSHTAILGATGTGKTELAFDLIRHAVGHGVKVICIDLTSQYAARLGDLSPTQLTISDAQAINLGQKLFDVETGAYGAGTEKKVLQRFASGLREEITKYLQKYLKDPNSFLALVELREISNTKATLWITEMYLSTLLHLAKECFTGDKVLVVIEEAHTVMPEASFAGLGDFDSKGTIAKITQLALQGRKYGIGLLVVAQRTATVSKSVLTQCNTIISFSCIDDTSIGFLRNVYGGALAESLPGLKRLRAVGYGGWIDAGTPIVFDVPFDGDKAAKVDWKSQCSFSQPAPPTSSSPPIPLVEMGNAINNNDDPPF